MGWPGSQKPWRRSSHTRRSNSVWCIRSGTRCGTVVWKERRLVARDLRAIYGAATLHEAEAALERLAHTWDAKYPTISATWRRDWSRLTVFFDYPAEIRKVIYTTNAIESLNFSLRKVLKGRGAFPTDESILKVLFLGMQRIAKKWTAPIPDWKRALNQFAML